MSNALDIAIGMGTKEATDKRPIERQFDRLRGEIQELDRVIETLIDRIHPVIGPSKEDLGGNPEEDIYDASGLAKALDEQSLVVRRMRLAVNQIIDRIEL